MLRVVKIFTQINVNINRESRDRKLELSIPNLKPIIRIFCKIKFESLSTTEDAIFNLQESGPEGGAKGKITSAVEEAEGELAAAEESLWTNAEDVEQFAFDEITDLEGTGHTSSVKDKISDVYEEESAITGEDIAKTRGLIEDAKTKKRYRADTLLEEAGIDVSGMTIEDMSKKIADEGIKSPDGNAFGEVKSFILSCLPCTRERKV